MIASFRQIPLHFLQAVAVIATAMVLLALPIPDTAIPGDTDLDVKTITGQHSVTEVVSQPGTYILHQPNPVRIDCTSCHAAQPGQPQATHVELSERFAFVAVFTPPESLSSFSPTAANSISPESIAFSPEFPPPRT
jgi:hypothetical protein